jgi:hypothetical protein
LIGAILASERQYRRGGFRRQAERPTQVPDLRAVFRLGHGSDIADEHASMVEVEGKAVSVGGGLKESVSLDVKRAFPFRVYGRS